MPKNRVKDLTGEMTEAARRIWLAGLGALAAAEEEGSKLFKTLVDRGEEFEKRTRPKVRRTVEKAGGKVKDAWEKVGTSFDERVAGVLKRLGVPTRRDLDRLTGQVERLGVAVEKLQKKKATGKRAVKKKPAGSRKVRKKKSS